MIEAELAAKIEAARRLRATTDWAKYPKLAAIFEHRPPENIYWRELVELIHQASRGNA